VTDTNNAWFSGETKIKFPLQEFLMIASFWLQYLVPGSLPGTVFFDTLFSRGSPNNYVGQLKPFFFVLPSSARC
jgi:hypothetical protein